MTSSAELRKQFLDFFQAKGHEIVASSSLVPGNDPTLLFTNAGMVPFKDVFLGFETRAYRRAASSQRCVRAGGKHNDLENVGYTARHHTFFEMLGNFSFGDYFKAEAIAYAWAFLTEVLKLPAERLWVTVYDEDDEAADIWLKQIKIDPARLSRIGAKDNFWSMGDTGPCGPCSEIFYDHGPEVAGGPPGTPEEDGDRYVEIWNLVFMQYDRNKDGELKPLPAPSVDTGMGLERLAAVMQGVHSNYAIDLFQHLIKATAELAGVADLNNPSLKVIADHIRSCAFLIVDGITPSNEKRGYVLRRIIRRAARHGHQLGLTQPFFHQLVAPLVQEMGEAYPELAKAQAHVEKVLRREEEQFAKTLERGLKILEGEIASMSGTTLSGDIIFELYATYGFPIDLTNDIARERALSLDMDGYAQRMKAHQETGGAGDEFGADYSQRVVLDGATVFTGYEALSGQGQVTALLKEGEQVERLKTGEEGVVVLDRTPFYAESGGQVGDTGSLSADGMAFSVLNTQKQGSLHLHVGRVDSGHIALGDTLQAQVQDLRRHATILNHSATHLMHAALRQVLGEHVQQKGSLVDPDRLRFDFSHFEPMSAEQITQVEHIVNAQIRANQDAHVQIMSMQGALESGAMALFGEKYGDEVRVVTIGFSTELCGGTHVKRAGDIGLFKIINESGTASGIRRIEAVTGENALRWVEDNAQRLEQIAQLVKSNRNDAHEKVRQMLDKTRQLEKELETLKSRLATQAGADLASQALDIKGLKVLAVNLPDADPKSLLDTLDQLKNKLGKAVVLLATVSDGKITLVAGVTKQETALIKAGDLVKSVAEQVGGKGGGRPDMARGGGVNPQALDAALQSVPVWVSEQLA